MTCPQLSREAASCYRIIKILVVPHFNEVEEGGYSMTRHPPTFWQESGVKIDAMRIL